MATWGRTSEEEEGSQEEEAVAALMAGSESKSEFESLSQLNDKVRGLSKAKIEKLLFTLLLDDCDEVNAENCKLKDVCSKLKRDMRML